VESATINKEAIMTKEREELLREIDYIVNDVWSGIATQKNIAEEMVEKTNLLMKHLRILRDELRAEEEDAR